MLPRILLDYDIKEFWTFIKAELVKNNLKSLKIEFNQLLLPEKIFTVNKNKVVQE